MNRLTRLFENSPKGLLNIYVTAGYPKRDDLPNIIKVLDESGVDIVEIGMPYSDPLADGVVIQQTSAVALKNGMTVDLLFQQIGEARSYTDMPFVIMGYLNQMIQYGVDKFLDNCRVNGVDGLIIPDLPPNIYEAEFKEKFEKRDIKKTFLITPQTSEDRIRYIDKLSNGFIYMVSDNSITGSETNLQNRQLEYFNRIREMDLSSPIMIGFGIHNREGYQQAINHSSGAIVGSAFLKALDTENLENSVREFIQKLRS